MTDWENNYSPKFRGVNIALVNHEMARSLAIRHDGSGFALGSEWHVGAFDATGKPIWKQDGPGAAWGVDFSADGQVLVVAYGDGTIRWLRWSDGEELLALFVEAPTRRWVAWTPTGYYMASAGGEDLIGWHVNRGWAQQADFFPASRFSARFNRPDIVQRVLKTRDEAEAVRQANEKAKRRDETTSVAAALPPVVAILSPLRRAAQVLRRQRRGDLHGALALRPADRSRGRADRRPPGRGARRVQRRRFPELPAPRERRKPPR